VPSVLDNSTVRGRISVAWGRHFQLEGTRMRRARFGIGALLGVLWVAPLGAQQATGTVRGRVTNAATQQPLAGVSVTVGRRAAVTRADGGYLLTDVPAGLDTVHARLIGYSPATQPVTVTGGDTVTVDLAMTARAVNLASVVVVGYGTKRAGDITTSASQLTSEDFNVGTITSPQQLIEDKIPGVQLVDNNEPGGGLSIRVRGTASVTASSEPLYVVDGVPLGTGSGGGLSLVGRDALNFINPNDIATITVLKDAASAAIYGTNASNGVVLITTKAGQGRGRVEYGSAFSAASVTRIASMLSAAQFRAAVAQYDTAGLAQLGSANTDWFGLVDQTGMGQQHNVAVSGSGATNNYRLSLGYFDQNGILKSSSTQRVSLAVNYDQRLYDDHLDLKANLKGSRNYDQFTPGGVLYNAAQMGPTQPVLDPTSGTDGTYFRAQNTQVNTVLDAYADYAPPVSLGPGKLDFTGGYSYSQSHGNYPSIFARQLLSNVLGDAGIPQTAIPPVPSFDVEDSKLISFFGRAGYNIDDRYLVSASIRRDGSSRFGAGNQWGNFPSLSVGWRISEEPFLRGVSAISDLKLRASWGKT